jgi:adenosylcobalamin-dependent ribonucleoside-triphosphate reductase
MYRLIWDFKFLPAGRGLWMMGTDVVYERGSACCYNCAFISTEDIGKVSFSEPFCYVADMSMLGVGVAFDLLGAGEVHIKQPKLSGTFVVPDSREGWVEAIRKTLEGYTGKEAPECVDYSKIRAKGEPIRTFGGVAPGPQPLIEGIQNINEVLSRRVGELITSVDILDLMNVIGKCVVSGGIRRTAGMSIGDVSDEGFMQAKDPELHGDLLTRWRWSSNNTIYANSGMDYSKAAEQTVKNGEPGYFWLENARAYGRMADPISYADARVMGMNPCGEVSLENRELCNIADTLPSRHSSYEEYRLTLKYCYLYLKTVTLVPTHNQRTNAVLLRNRRVGLSQTGIVESFARHGRATHFEWCDMGYHYLQDLDKIYSEWLCVPRSIKYTTCKPSGTTSLLPGVTSGIHYAHSQFYFRTIRIDSTSALLEPLRNAGYRMEESVCGDNTIVVYFPVKEKFFERSKSEVSIWEQMENAAMMQHFWADNQVSVTVTFKQEEKDDVQRVLEVFQHRLKSVSFLPLKDHKYLQAPLQEITEEEYLEAVSKLKPLVLGKHSHEVDDKGCSGDSCTLKFDNPQST